MWHLNTESIWHDEAWSIRAIRGPFTTPDDNTPFVYYSALHLLWRAGAGETPLAFRYGSVLIDLLAVALAIRLARRWYGLLAALAAGLLVGASPLLWEYAQEVRAYVAVPLVALAMLAGGDALLKHKPGQFISPRLWGVVFAVELVGLYTHNLAVPLVVWLNVALGLAWLYRRDWPHMVVWAGLQIALIVLYIPWLLTQSPSGTALNTPPELSISLIRDIWRGYFLPVLAQLRDAQANARAGVDLLTPIDLFGLLAILLAAVHVFFDRSRRAWLLISHVLLVPLFSTALILAASIDFHPRYYIAAAPGTLLLVVGGVAVFLRSLPRHFVRPRPVAGAYTLVIAWGLLLSAISIDDITHTRTYQHDDFAGLAEYYATLPADAVILIPFDAERALQDYYARRLDIEARFVNVPLYADEAAALEVINALASDGPRHVEFLTWFQLPADPRGMYPCLLTAAHVGDSIAPPRTYFGLSTQAFAIGPIDLLPLSSRPAFREITLQAAAYAASRQGVCLRTGWSLPQPVDEDIRVAAALLNPLGDPIARDNADITRPDNVGTSRWSPGESGQAYNLLQLPAGAPQTEYEVALNVFSPSRPSGFDVLDTSGNPAGVDYLLPAPITAAGPPIEDEDADSLPTVTDDAGEDRTIDAGAPLHVTLVVPAGETDTTIPVTLEGDGWTLEQSAAQSTQPQLSWHAFLIPPGSEGQAVLRLNSEAVARYTVVDLDRRFDPPDFETPVGVAFPGVATLAGVTVPQTTITPSIPPQVTLIWRAESTPETAYTVFVQLLSEDGRVLAQSDSPPAGGTRPTTGWLAGEYVTDTHTLTFNVTNYTGPAYLIAGLYSVAGDGFHRLETSDGADYVPLPLMVEVAR